MDTLKNNNIEDIKDSTKNIIFDNNAMTLNRSIAGHALCINAKSKLTVIKELPGAKEKQYFISFWINHQCSSHPNRYAIFIATKFTLFCDNKGYNYGKSVIMVAYNKNNYFVMAKYGLWYHMSIVIDDGDITIYIDGLKQSILGVVRKSIVMTSPGIELLKSDGNMCLDELLVSSNTKSPEEVKDIYQSYIPGNLFV